MCIFDVVLETMRHLYNCAIICLDNIKAIKRKPYNNIHSDYIHRKITARKFIIVLYT